MTALLQNDAKLVRDIADRWGEVKKAESETARHVADKQKEAHAYEVDKQFTLVQRQTWFRYALSLVVVGVVAALGGYKVIDAGATKELMALIVASLFIPARGLKHD